MKEQDIKKFTPGMQGLKDGDIVTIEGRYKPRSFLEWLTRKPKQLQQYKVIL